MWWFFRAIRNSTNDQKTHSNSETRHREKHSSDEVITYEDVLLNGLRYVSNDVEKIERLTLNELRLSIKASQLRKLDELSNYTDILFTNRAVNSTKTVGKKIEYVIKNKDEILDVKAKEKEILNNGEIKNKRLKKKKKRVKRLNKQKGG